MSQKLKIAEPNATAIARPPGRGMGRGWARRPPGMSSIPSRRASTPTSGVAIAPKANASSVEPARRTEVEDTAGTITTPTHSAFQTRPISYTPHRTPLHVRLLGRPGLEHDRPAP